MTLRLVGDWGSGRVDIFVVVSLARPLSVCGWVECGGSGGLRGCGGNDFFEPLQLLFLVGKCGEGTVTVWELETGN